MGINDWFQGASAIANAATVSAASLIQLRKTKLLQSPPSPRNPRALGGP